MNNSNNKINNNSTLSSFKKAPCMGCELRCIGCHSNCEQYNQWSSMRNKRSNDIYNEKKKNSIIIGYEVSKSNKIKKYK